MRRRSLVVLLLLAAVLAWWVLPWVLSRGGEYEPAPSPVSRDGRPAGAVEEVAVLRGAAPSPAGVSPVVTAERDPTTGPAPRRLAGVVRDREGGGVGEATVFLLSKGDAEGPAARTETDENGRFDLGRQDPRGHWIGAVQAGHLPAHLDGDALEQDGELELVLEPGPEVRVTLSDGEGGSLELDTRIRVTADGEARDWPRPDEAWAVKREAVIPPGSRQVRLRIGTRGPVRILASYRNVMPVLEPHFPRFDAPPAHVAFTVRPSCVLDITILDDESGEPLDRGFDYRLMRGDTVATGGSTTLAGGRITMAYRLPPGTYVFQAWANGYRRHEGSTVVLQEFGERAEVEVRLERDPTLGSLRVSIPVLARLPTIPSHDGTPRAPPANFLFERPSFLGPYTWAPDPDERHGAWGGLRGEKTRESDTDYLFTFVPAGEVSLLVMERISGRAAFAARVRITAGRTETVTIDLEPGLLVPVDRYVSEEGTTRSFLVRHPVFGVLPTCSSVSGYVSSLWQPGAVPGRTARIGPYPGPTLEIVVEDEAGETTTHAVRAQDD